MNSITNLGPATPGAARDTEAFLVLPQKAELNDLAYEQGPQRYLKQQNAKQQKHQTGTLSRAFNDTLGVSLEAHVADWLGYDPFAIQYVFDTPPAIEDGDVGGLFEVKRADRGTDVSIRYRTKENREHIIIHGMVEHNGVDTMKGNIILLGWVYPVFDQKYAYNGGYDNQGRPMSYIKSSRRRTMASLMPLLRGEAA